MRVIRLTQAGNIEKYNGETSLPYWTNEYANRINGTDSTIWHANTKKNDDVYIFSPDLCRSLHLQYSEIHYNIFGIETLRFTLPTNVFDNIPENEGFCLNTTDSSDNSSKIECLPTGLMSLKSCLKRKFNNFNYFYLLIIVCLASGGESMLVPLPIIASSPHFLGAADSVQNAVHGLHPDQSIHQSYMDVEPITGSKHFYNIKKKIFFFFLCLISCNEWITKNADQYKCC